MFRLALTCIVLLLFSQQMNAQYDLYKEVQGVQFYVKWSHEKWWSKKSPKVLLVKVKNNNTTAVDYTLGIDFFVQMKQVESRKEESYCLGQRTTASPRVKGLVFAPSPEILSQSGFTFELTGLDVELKEERNCSQP